MKPYWLLLVAAMANAKLPEYPDFTVGRTGLVGSASAFATRCAATTDLNIDWTLTQNVGVIIPISGIASQTFSVAGLANGPWVCYVDVIDAAGAWVASTNRVAFVINAPVPNAVFDLRVN